MSMVSPDYFVEQYEDMSYEELLPVRDELIDEIRALETSGNNAKYPGNTKYQEDLKYLSKLCELVAEKFNDMLWEQDLS